LKSLKKAVSCIMLFFNQRRENGEGGATGDNEDGFPGFLLRSETFSTN
jgi:hypothetical protein